MKPSSFLFAVAFLSLSSAAWAVQPNNVSGSCKAAMTRAVLEAGMRPLRNSRFAPWLLKDSRVLFGIQVEGRDRRGCGPEADVQIIPQSVRLGPATPVTPDGTVDVPECRVIKVKRSYVCG